MLLDSDIIIFSFKSDYQYVHKYIQKGTTACCSAVSIIEVLGFHKLSDNQYAHMRKFMDTLTILSITESIVDQAVALRRQHNIKTPDAVIAATALVHRLPLATNNLKHFNRVEGLEVVNPLVEV